MLLVGVPLVYAAFTGSSAERRQVSKTQYEALVRSAWADVQRAFRATDVRPSLLAERVAAAQETLRTAADRLAGVIPPRELRGENLVIAQALEEYADDLEEVRQAAVAGNARRIAAFNERLAGNRALARIAEAAEEMQSKGYDLGPIAEE